MELIPIEVLKFCIETCIGLAIKRHNRILDAVPSEITIEYIERKKYRRQITISYKSSQV